MELCRNSTPVGMLGATPTSPSSSLESQSAPFLVKQLISSHRVLGGMMLINLLVSTRHMVKHVAILCDQLPRGEGMVFVLGQPYILIREARQFS